MFMFFFSLWGAMAGSTVLPAQPPQHPGRSTHSEWARPSESFEVQARGWLEAEAVSEKEIIEKIIQASSKTDASRAKTYAALCDRVYKKAAAPYLQLTASAKVYADDLANKKDGHQSYSALASAFADAVAAHPKSPPNLKLAAKEYALAWAKHLKITDPSAREKSLDLLQSHYAGLQKEHYEACHSPSRGLPPEADSKGKKSSAKSLVHILKETRAISDLAGRPPNVCKADMLEAKPIADPCDQDGRNRPGEVRGWDASGQELEPIKAWLKQIPGISSASSLKVTPIQVQNAQLNLGIFKVDAPPGPMILKAEKANEQGDCPHIHRHWSLLESGFRQGLCDKGRTAISKEAPFIPRIYAWAKGEDPQKGKLCFSLMDEASGKPFAEVLEKSTSPEREAWMKDFGKVVAQLHFKTKSPSGQYHVHGDLHWNNVMLDTQKKKWTLIDVGTMEAFAEPMLENKASRHRSIKYDLNQCINPLLEFRGALLQYPIQRLLNEEPDLEKRRSNLKTLIFDPKGVQVENQDYLKRARSNYARFNAFIEGYLGQMSKKDRRILAPFIKSICEGPYDHFRNELIPLDIKFENHWKKNPYFFLGQKRFPEIEQCFKILHSNLRRF